MASFAWKLILNTFRKPRPDVIVASGPHLFTLIAGVVMAKLRRTALVVEVRDLWPQSLVDLGALNPKSAMARILYCFERMSYRAADHIVFALPLGKEYLNKLGLDKPVTIIPNGIPQELAMNNTGKVIPQRRQYQFLAVYAGLLGVANNVDQILDAAKILDSQEPGRFGFVIYGTGPLREHLVERVATENISNVHIQAPVSRESVLAIIRGSADATLFTLRPADVFRYGISPNKISDYLAAAKPMVFSCRAGNNIALEAGCGVTADPGDSRSLAGAIANLAATDPTERKKMGERGFQYLLRHYITEDHASAFGQVIITAAGGRQSDAKVSG